jgi:hypothetical protein
MLAGKKGENSAAAMKKANETLPQVIEQLAGVVDPDELEKLNGFAGEDRVLDINEFMMLGKYLETFMSPKGRRTLSLEESKAIPGMTVDRAENAVVQEGADGQIFIDDKPTGLTAEDAKARSGLTGDNTLDREIVKAEVASRNLVDLVERTTTQIDAIPQSGVGLTGKLSRGLDEVAAELTGIYTLIGGTESIGGKDVPVGSLLNPELYEFTGDLANASAAVKSNYITLAYLKARSMEPGGRLAKDDVKLAMDSLGGDWASKGKMKAALNETSWQALNGLKNYYRATGNIGKFPKDLYEKMDSLKVGSYENAPPVGTVVDGYRYVDGDPADPSNWTKVDE